MKIVLALPYTGMKPWRCNGSNDNCRYCSGWGYVGDETPLPIQGHPPNNPYIGMKPPTPPELDPEIWEEIVRQCLLSQEEENGKRLASKKRELGFLVLLAAICLLILFLVWFSRR